MSNIPQTFDRALVAGNRDRVASGFPEFDFLKREVTDRLLDRLHDITRKFPVAVELGAHTGQSAGFLKDGAGGIETLTRCDLSRQMVSQIVGATDDSNAICVDEEILPFAENSLDLVFSAWSLHWVNDLPGTFAQIRWALRPDGLFLAAIPGLGTLDELRGCLLEADMEVTGGAGPRVSPFVDTRDAGSLLQRAGFALPVVDTDRITVTWENMFALMRDLRGMGEANAVSERRKTFTPRRVFMRAAEIYAERYGQEDGRIPATFEIVYLTGWAPAASQQQPLRPGSAEHRLADALGGEEKPA